MLAAVLLCLAGLPVSGQPLRQFAQAPAPARVTAPPLPSAAEEELAYRRDAARHLYTLYAPSVYRGRLPPLLYAVMVVETLIDANGSVVAVEVVRKPAAAEVEPWVTSMIRQASPFPAPTRLPEGTARYVDVWLVDRSGRFQVDTLTEGQR